MYDYKHRILSSEETMELVSRSKSGDNEATEILVRHNMRIISSIASRFPSYTKEDMIQVGLIGFLKAIRDFKPELGWKFSTYFVPKVYGEMQRYARDYGDHGTCIKHSRRATEYSIKIRKLLQKEDISLNEAIQVVGVPEAYVYDVIQVFSNVAYIDEVVFHNPGDDSITLIEMIESRKSNQIGYSDMINDFKGFLTNKQYAVFQLRFIEGMGQQEIADTIGVSQVQVSRIEAKIKEMTQKWLNGEPIKKGKDVIPKKEIDINSMVFRSRAEKIITLANYGWSTKEIAAACNMTVKGVSSSIYQSRRRGKNAASV